MIDAIKRLFRRKHTTPRPARERLRVGDGTSGMGQGEDLSPLRIEGVKPAPLTPQPDDAELAAQALLETMCNVRSKMEDVREVAADARQPIPADAPTRSLSPISHHTSVRDAQYYHALADRIRAARDDSRRRTLRFVAWAEGQLALPSLPVTGPGSLQLIERELLKRVDIIEQMGDRLKRRWQHCLATVTVRLMQADGRVEEDRKNEEDDTPSTSQPEETTII